MKTMNIRILFCTILFSLFSPYIRADWKITGDAIEQGGQAILEQNPNNNQEFIYVGKLSNRPFKITDGTRMYIQECGDNDPLGDFIPLREENNADETGLRIRYSGQQDYFKVTLKVIGNAKSLEVERIEPPKNMYIMGGPFNNEAGNWNLQDAVELKSDKDNPFIFYYKGDIRYNPLGSERGSIKVLKGRSWGENYHPDATGDVALTQAIGMPLKMRLGGQDNKWTIPADRSGDGYYEIKIDMLNLTITVEKFNSNIVENPFPLAVYIAGNAMPCGWDNANPMKMRKTEDGIYQWEGKVSRGPFKFLQRRGTWHRCYVATSEDVQVSSGNEYNIVYEENYNEQGNDYKFVATEAEVCQFTLNLNTMKLRVGTSSTSIEEVTHDNCGITYFSNEGRLFLKSNNDQPLQAYVLSIDGKAVARRRFVENTDIALPKGYYIVLLNNEAGGKITHIKAIVN